MLESTFIHCPGVGLKTERALWESGAGCWNEYLALDGALRKGGRHALLEPLVRESIDRFRAADFAWFARQLPLREHWRAYLTFKRRAAFLDIETTGGMGPDALTVVGLYDGLRLRQFVKGDNLEEFPEAVQAFSMLISFFGSGFDIPFLKRAFRMEFAQLHIDLCFMLKRLGHKGGLKKVERSFGCRRSAETEGLDGSDAVDLWWQYRRGDEKALARLLAYNAEDVVNLETLIEAAYPRMVEMARAGM